MSRKKTTTSTDKEGNSKTVIVVAVIGLLGTIATAFFGFLASTKPTEITINATPTAEAKLNLVSPITSATSTLTKQSDTPTPTESVGTSAPSTNKILFDTNHQEWGVEYGKGDINIVRSLGYQIDMAESPKIVSSLDSQYTFQTVSNSPYIFEFETTQEYPVIGIWIEEGADSANLTLEAETGQTFQAFLWSPFGFTNYIDIAYFENSPGKWTGNLTSASGGNYIIHIAAFEKAPLNPELLNQYSIVWLHNPIRQLLPQEQKDLLNYVVSGGKILYVDNESDVIFESLIKGAFPDGYYPEQGAEIRLYNSTFGLGRLVWVYPKIANPVLYIDSANQETALDFDKIRQIMHWLETGTW
ncbi:MAG: hypothetical protein Q8L68_00250 [Methylococcales bacterium]|nr:hypothetical protein [Methylococcales bacterium]